MIPSDDIHCLLFTVCKRTFTKDCCIDLAQANRIEQNKWIYVHNYTHCGCFHVI